MTDVVMQELCATVAPREAMAGGRHRATGAGDKSFCAGGARRATADGSPFALEPGRFD